MTPQKCENCNGEFKTGINKFDSSLIGYPFYLCKGCQNEAINEFLKWKRE